MAWTDYTWIVVVGSLAAFFTAYGIGANDVANAFGSSVAARTLTIRQALLIASVCEFSGSVLLGSEVTRTVAGGIARLSAFDREPELYMYGMLCATVASGMWLLLATYLSLPVSTTHATIGAVLGFAFVYGGPDAVTWLEPQERFPYMGGLVPIVMAWFTSPLLSGLASTFLFLAVRTAILRRARSLELAIWALPVLVLATVFINLFFVLYQGSEARLNWSSDQCAWVSAVAAGGCALLTMLVGVPFVRQRVFLARCLQNNTQLGPRGNAAGTPGRVAATTAATSRSLPGFSARPSPGGSNGGSAGGGFGVRTAGAFTAGGPAAATRLSCGPLGSCSRGASRGLSRGGSGEVMAAAGTLQGLPSNPLGDPGAQVCRPPPPAWSRLSRHSPQLQLQHQAHQGSFSRRHGAAGSEQGSRGAQPGAISPAPSGTTSHLASDPDQPVHPLHPGQRQEQQPQQPPQGRGVEGPLGEQASALACPPDVLAPRQGTSSAGVSDGREVEPGQWQLPQHGTQQPAARQQQGQGQQLDGGVLVPAAGDGRGGGGGTEGGITGVAATSSQLWQGQQQEYLYWQQQGQQQEWLMQQQYWQQQQQLQQLQQQCWQQQQPPNFSRDTSRQPQNEPRQRWQQQQGLNGGQNWQEQQWQQQQLWQQQQQQKQWQIQTWQLTQQQQWSAGQRPHWNQTQQEHSQQQQLLQAAWRPTGQQAAADPGRPPTASPRPIAEFTIDSTPNTSNLVPSPYWGPVAEGAEGSLGADPAQYGAVQVGHDGSTSPPWVAVLAAAAVDESDSGSSTAGDPNQCHHPPTEQRRGHDQRNNDNDNRSNSNHNNSDNNMQWLKTFDQLKAIVLHGTEVNVHACIEQATDPVAAAMHAQAEVFDTATEHAFKYLQVVTAICDSFSHGANDVANSVGPLAAIWFIYRNQRVDQEATVPVWILVLGGAGIVVGLATYGYNIISAIGVRLSVVTPSRGFCIELSTALVVVLASMYGLPVSTTHCQVGATAGMGLLEGAAGINWPLAAQFMLGWLVTLLITGLLSAAMFAAGAYAPSIQQSRAINTYENELWALSTRLDLLLNRTNTAALSDPATWGNYSADLAAALEADLRTLQAVATPGSATGTRPVQHVEASNVTTFLNRTLSTYLNNSLPYMGGMHARGQVLPRRP